MAEIVSNKVTTVELDASEASISNLAVNGEANFAKSMHESIEATEGNIENLVVNGAARFVQPIHAEINGSKDINTVTASTTIPDTYYVMISDGTSLRRITFANFCSAVASKLGINPSKTYLTIE